ncbi:MAG: FAD-binding oxidoreductase [Rhizobiales bacterium]|nr:FAD-binding oxidoreductase [Hyphomicrobiales bacterium]
MGSDNQTFEIVVIGGGIFGLSVARHAAGLGLSVLLAEADRIGQGPSGGLLGALMPHIPTGWNAKKQFQFEALCALPGFVAELEAETGLSCGYARSGRLMPLRTERFAMVAREREAAAPAVWGDFRFARGDDACFSDWLSTDAAPHGYVLDTLAARLQPRAYLAALAASLRGRASVREGMRFDGFSDGVARFNGGRERVRAGAVVLAQGYQTFDHLHQVFALDIGSGVKGQAALFRLPKPLTGQVALPVIYDDGVYIVAHDDGTCAVGSTSEKDWQDAKATDGALDSVLEKAFALCPSLKQADLVERWAGVRPKCHAREPIVGQLFANQPLYVATGGFKVSFGIAHKVAAALGDVLAGRSDKLALPDSFKVEHHLDPRR